MRCLNSNRATVAVFGLVLHVACQFAELASLFAQSPSAAAEGETQIAAEDPQLGRAVDFEKDISPIFESKCFACHSSALKENGLSLEEHAAVLKGGKSGPSVVPGDADGSLLFRVSSRQSPAMPPLPNKVEATAVTPRELGLIRQWIREGATAGSGSDGKSTNMAWSTVSTRVQPIYTVALSADDSFAVCGRGQRLTVYSLATNELAADLIDPALPGGVAHRDLAHCVAISPDGTTIASGGYREVKLWTRSPNSITRSFSVGNTVPTAAAVSPNSQLLAIATPQLSIHVFNTADGQPLRVMTGHSAVVTGLAFSADSSTLVSVSQDQTIRSWNAVAGEFIASRSLSQPLTAVAVLADGVTAVLGTEAGPLLVLPTPVATAPDAPVPDVRNLPGHTAAVTSLVSVSNGTSTVVTGSKDGSVRVWDINSGGVVRQMAHTGGVTTITCSADGQRIASTGGDGMLRVWDGSNGAQLSELRGDARIQRLTNSITAEENSLRGLHAAATAAVPEAENQHKQRTEALQAAETAAAAAKAKLDPEMPKLDAAEKAYADAKTALAASPENAELKAASEAAEKTLNEVKAVVKPLADAAKSADGVVQQAKRDVQLATDAVAAAKSKLEKATTALQTAEAAATKQREVQAADARTMLACTFGWNGKLLVAASDKSTLHTVVSKSGQPAEVFDMTAATAMLLPTPGGWLAFRADGSVDVGEATGGWKLSAVLGGNAADSSQPAAASPFVDRVISLAFSPDGQFLATGGGDPSRSGELMLWKVADRSLVKTFTDAHSDVVYGCEFSHNGTQLATCSADKFVRIWDVASGSLLKSFEGHTNHVLDVTWRADGRFVASAGADNLIKVWNIETGEQQLNIGGFGKQVTSIQFLGFGANIVSCSGDRSVRFHQSENGGNYRNFGGSGDFNYAVAASNSEKLVVAGGQDGVLRVWNGETGELLQQFSPPAPVAPATAAK